ncbi:MAG TPA: hypothetical protein VHA05_00825 [Candidatus Saccharimonadales bacterium]|nr:hypothetical protein [Candidatus Saccharimonadales bacterium]
MRVFEPTDGHFSDQETGVVLFNQFGATVSQDAGRDAQVMADSFHLPVLAVDRPGTAGFFPSKKLARRLSTPNGYLAEVAILGEKIDGKAEKLGVKKLVATGRSAGGLGALALVRSETVSSTSAICVAEPVACEDMPLKQGAERYSEYNKHQKELLNDDSMALVRPLPPGLPLLPAIGRLISIPPAMLFDRFHNQRLFASDAAIQYAAYIAENMAAVDTTLEFAEHSMVATPDVYKHDVQPVAELRKEGAPFVVKQLSGTVHASFDNRNEMNRVIAPTIERTIER